MNLAGELFNAIQLELNKISLEEFTFSSEETHPSKSKKFETVIHEYLQSAPLEIRQRVHNEYFSWGPISDLLLDQEITEIIVNGPLSIWFEKNGTLHKHQDQFFSDLSFRNCIDRISMTSNTHLTKEFPCVDGKFLGFRLSMVGSDITQSGVHMNLRRHPDNPWTLPKLIECEWCTHDQAEFLKSIHDQKKNFIVIGATGSGKTSVLNAFLDLMPQNERIVIIEDASEISLPNSASMKLLTREDPQGVLPEIDQGHLVKRSLRLRPDRLVMGEVRGGEAKDFLMAMATGHPGSFGTLHSHDPHQAMIRLEMLIQIGAPQWNLNAIRRLIHHSLDFIIVTGKDFNGKRKFKGAYKLSSLEESGILLESIF